MSDPSRKAVEAAYRAIYVDPTDVQKATIDTALAAAHNPALGLERSVCLRDVVDWMLMRGSYLDAEVALLQREFGGRS